MNKKETPLSDRERILTYILNRIAGGAYEYKENKYTSAVHFCKYRKPVKGDLVMAETSGYQASKFSIAYYLEPLPGDYGGAVVYDIIDGQMCNYANESFVIIMGVPDEVLLLGTKKTFLQKVYSAFRRGGEYWYRYGGIKFLDGNMVEIIIREAFDGSCKEDEYSKPIVASMSWNYKTSIKNILDTMVVYGYGTSEFKHIKKEPNNE